MQHIEIGDLRVSRFILGSNPFSGYSHQTSERDLEMKRYYTTERIKQTLREAESLGVTALIARTDHHIVRVLLEYWDQGGAIQWLGQTCRDVGNQQICAAMASSGHAKACHIHGGAVDFLLAQGRINEVRPAVETIHKYGMLAGIAGHNPKVFKWAERNLDVDYYLCSYYNAAHRDERAEYVSGMREWFLEEDRRIMSELIQSLSKPVIHYKIMAAGRNDPEEAFAHAARHMRANDAVCVGVYTKDNPAMLRQDVALLETCLQAPIPE